MYQPSFGDLAHLGHVELLTPEFEASLTFFTKLMGLHEADRVDESVYLRAWGDYERFTLKLTCSETSGLDHVAFRAKSAAVLAQLDRLEQVTNEQYQLSK
jgi:catechol 2,3-dioxygenase